VSGFAHTEADNLKNHAWKEILKQ